MRAGTTSMIHIIGVVCTMITNTTSWKGTVTIIIIFIMFTKMSINMGTVRNQASRRKHAMTEGRMTISGTIDTGRKEILTEDNKRSAAYVEKERQKDLSIS